MMFSPVEYYLGIKIVTYTIPQENAYDKIKWKIVLYI